MPRVSGSYEGLPSSGLSQITRPARRLMRSSSAARTSGSPVSQPSERMITIVRRSTSDGQPRLNSASDSPIRVPPDQSFTAVSRRSTSR